MIIVGPYTAAALAPQAFYCISVLLLNISYGFVKVQQLKLYTLFYKHASWDKNKTYAKSVRVLRAIKLKKLGKHKLKI